MTNWAGLAPTWLMMMSHLPSRTPPPPSPPHPPQAGHTRLVNYTPYQATSVCLTPLPPPLSPPIRLARPA